MGKKVNNTKHALEKGLLYIFNNEIEEPREFKKIMKEVTQMKSTTKIVSKMILLVIVFTLIALTCHFSKSMILTVLVGSIVAPILTVRFYFLLFDLKRTLKGRKSDVDSKD